MSKKRLINPRDLRRPKYFYLFFPGQWREGYKHPSIVIYSAYGRQREYAEAVLDLCMQQDTDNCKGFCRAYGLTMEYKPSFGDRTEIAIKILREAGKWAGGNDYRRVLRIMHKLKIPRFVSWRALDSQWTDHLHVPRAYKGRESDYKTALALVAAA